MATAILRPDSDNGGWNVTNAATRWEAVDEAVTQPTAGSDADGYVSVAAANAVVTFDLTAPTDVDVATSATVWVHGRTSSDEDIIIDLLNAAGTVLATTTASVGTSYGWHSASAPVLTLTQADVDGLQVRLTAKKVGGGGMGTVFANAVYVDLTYTALSLNRSARVTFAEMELPDGARLARVTWAEMEAPDVPVTDRSAWVAWSEVETPDAPRIAHVLWVEAEVPDAPRRAHVAWAEMETPQPARAGWVLWAVLEVPHPATGGTTIIKRPVFVFD